MSFLQRQIEEEMQREAAIDKRIEIMQKRWFRQPANRKYKVIPTKEGADAVLIFNRKELNNFHVVLCGKNNDFPFDPAVSMIFLKNENPHDSKSTTYADIRNAKPRRKNLNETPIIKGSLL